jgi:hypothetical protein
MGHVHSSVQSQVRILDSTSVPFGPTTVQMPNLALVEVKRITVRWVGGWEKERPVICLNVGDNNCKCDATESFSMQRFDDLKHRRLVTVLESYAIWSQSEQINILYTSA